MLHLSKYIKFFFLILAIMLSSCHVFRYVGWNFADADDYRKFDFRTVEPSNDHFKFQTTDRYTAFAIPVKFQTEKVTDLESLLSKYKTLSFIVIHNDTIKYSYYGQGCTDTSQLMGFSISKSVVSALAGIAIKQDSLLSPAIPVAVYIPALRDTMFRHIKLVHLLEMRAGLKFSESYSNPFGLMARFYYGTNLRKYAENLKCTGTPGDHYEYQSGCTQLVSMAVENATGQTTDHYLQEKIWKRAGMDHRATWSIDSKKHNNVKAFGGLNATAPDFARFGRLYLNHGMYRNEQVIPAEWITATRTVSNDSRDSKGYPYTLGWRVTEKGELFAKGILGQYIYINYDKKIVIVRFGSKAGDIDWVELFSAISEQF